MRESLPIKIFVRIGLIVFGILIGLLVMEFCLRLGGFALSTQQRAGYVWKPEYEDDIRILALGESTTANGFEFSWPSQLEKILNNRSNKSFKVFNKGIGGTRSSFIAARLDENLRKFKPNIVITMIGINDELFGINTVYKETLSTKLKLWIENLRVYKLGFYIFAAIKPKRKDSFEGGFHYPSIMMETVIKARQLANQGNLTGAETLFKKAINLSKDHPLPYLDLGGLYLTKNEYELAGENFQKAFALGPDKLDYNYDRPSLYQGLGHYYSWKGDNLKAEKMFSYAANKEFERDWAFTAIENLQLQRNISKSTIRRNYRKWGFDFDVNTVLSNYNKTKYNYNLIYQKLAEKGIKLIAVQYPLRDVKRLKGMLNWEKSIVFVSNKENFENALLTHAQEELFVDMFAGDFGHATAFGNKLIAENVAEAVLNIT